MNAVAEKPKARRPAAPAPATKPSLQAMPSGERERTPRNLLAAFDIVVDALEAADATDEEHARSGDSDRLLRIAARDADNHGANANTAEAAQELAFDLAAMIKASRRVPGDVESPERTRYLEQAVAQLAWMADVDAAELVPVVANQDTAPAQVPAAPVASMSNALHDTLSMRFDKASAILSYLVRLFGGDAGCASPRMQPGLPGALHHVERLLDSIYMELTAHAEVLPRSLLDIAWQADSLIKLLDSTERGDDYDFRFSDAIYCDYLHAAQECVDRASALLDTAQSGGRHG